MVRLQNSVTGSGLPKYGKIFLEDQDIHLKLALFNHNRLKPKLPSNEWKAELNLETKMRALEHEMLWKEISLIQPLMEGIPLTINEFIDWFKELTRTGPGQNDPLFDWLEESANREEMTWLSAKKLQGRQVLKI